MASDWASTYPPASGRTSGWSRHSALSNKFPVAEHCSSAATLGTTMEAISLRRIRCLDGLHYSFQLLRHYHSGLWETCCEIPLDNGKVIPVLAACWGFVDALHRIREIAQTIPGLSTKRAEMRAFLTASSLAEEYRHYIQHLRRELAKDPPNSFPVWGTLSWADEDNPKKAHTALLGAQIPGTSYSSCVYDSQERKWVSKVCLGVNNKSFNFDTIFDSSIRFEGFVLSFLLEGASDEIKFHEKLPIFSVEFVERTIA